MATKPSRALLQARKRIAEYDELVGSKLVTIAGLQDIIDNDTVQVRDLQLRLGERMRELTDLAAKSDADTRRVIELEAQNAEMGQQVVDQGARIKQLIVELDRVRNVSTGAETRAKTAENNNGDLRDALHRLTVEKARLEGQLERVHEFDPVTELRQYNDGLSSIETVGRGGAMVADGDRFRWYRRAG